MKTYTINGTAITLEDVMYYEFFVGSDGEPQFLTMKWDKILSKLESGKMDWDSNKTNIRMLSRWVNEAPRKRKYRDLMQGAGYREGTTTGGLYGRVHRVFL